MSALTPAQTAEAAVNAGLAKVSVSPLRLVVNGVLAGAFIALGGALSLIVGCGFPGLTADNPALQRLLSGAMFPIGLILVVILGAELFTGNNAVLIPAWRRGHYGFRKIVANWCAVYILNFVGAIAFTWLLVYEAGLTASPLYRDATVAIATAKTSLPWLTVFVRGIGANWCVCLAVWLALSSRSTIGKMAGCWLPVMAFVALGYEHSIANMFYLPLGILNGAPVTAWQAIVDNLIPATLGNVAGGALFVGLPFSLSR